MCSFHCFRSLVLSAVPIIRNLGWLTINELTESETLKNGVKVGLWPKAPTYLTAMFVRLSDSFKGKQNWPFRVVNWVFYRTVLHTKLQNCGAIFPSISNHPEPIMVVFSFTFFICS